MTGLLRAEHLHPTRQSQLSAQTVRRFLVPVRHQSATAARTLRGEMRANTYITASIRFTGLKFDTWITSLSDRPSQNARASPGHVGPPIESAIEKIGDHRDVTRDAAAPCAWRPRL